MDRLTPEQRHKNMQHIRAKDTSIELILRKALWNAGVRYRKYCAKLPGKPDIAIAKYRLAIFCDSAFWHGRDYENMVKPKTNAEFWDKKIRRNIERDSEVNHMYQEMGWTVLRFWDTDIKKHTDDCVKIVINAINKAKQHSTDNSGNLPPTRGRTVP